MHRRVPIAVKFVNQPPKAPGRRELSQMPESPLQIAIAFAIGKLAAPQSGSLGLFLVPMSCINSYGNQGHPVAPMS